MKTRDLLRKSWELLFIVAAFLLLQGNSPSFAAEALDGKSFVGEIGGKDGSKTVKDEFVFENGKFNSTLCSRFGYGQGAYQANAQGDAIHFDAVTVSSSGGKKTWQGTVKGDAIEGTALTNENGETSEDQFKATLKK